LLLVVTNAIISASTLSAEEKPPCVKLINADVVHINHFTGSGSVVLLLRNNTKSPAELALTANALNDPSASVKVRFQPVEDASQNQPHADSSATPALPLISDAAAYIEKAVPAESNRFVRLVVADVWKDGDLDLELRNHYGKEIIGKVHIERSPLAIRLDEPKLALDLSQGNPSQVVVRNDGPLGYPSRWLILNGDEVCSGQGDFAPMSSSVLNCSPQASLSTSFFARLTNGDAWLDAIKPDVPHDGYKLILLPHPPKEPSPLHTSEPVTIFSGQGSLHYWSPVARTAIRYAVMFALLFLGGYLSQYLSYFIPNRLLLDAARDDLSAVANKSRDLSSKLDSKLLTNARLQQRRLTDFLASRSPKSAEFASMVAEFQAGLSLLSKRIDILQQVETVFVTLESSQAAGLPPTIIDEALQHLEKVKIVLSKLEITEDEIALAKTSATAALARVTPPNQIPADFGSQLKLTLKNAVTSFDRDSAAPDSAYRYVKSKMSNLLDSIEKLAASTSPIGEADYEVASYLAEKAKIIATYIALRENVIPSKASPPQPESASQQETIPERTSSIVFPVTVDRKESADDLRPDVTAEMSDRLQRYTEELFFFLHTFSLDGLRSAKLLIREMTDDIYPIRITEAILHSTVDAPEVEIEVDPPNPRENSPVEIRVRFFDSRLDNCAAREEFRVTWEFGDDRLGEGWSIYHYYQDRVKNTGLWPWIEGKAYSFRRFIVGGSKPVRVYPQTIKAKIQRIEAIARGKGNETRENASGLESKVSKNAKITVHPKMDVPGPKEIKVETAGPQFANGRSEVENRKFFLALAIAAIALIAGAEAQLAKLDLVPGLIAVFFTGFSADSMKRLIADSARPSKPSPATNG
jgi:hypothetical protein